MITQEQRIRKCRDCGCTEDNCELCIRRTGKPCHWVAPDWCSACRDRHAGHGLVAIETDNGPRHHIEGRPVRAGNVIEIRIGQVWIPSRYEWTFKRGTQPTLVVDGGHLLPNADARYRWPAEAS